MSLHVGWKIAEIGTDGKVEHKIISIIVRGVNQVDLLNNILEASEILKRLHPEIKTEPSIFVCQ